ncbi:hypothetical protein [Leptothoe spongobia]|uniref:Uncharacterized protein n=1 Tax=Leptothoe spongobia TAU-MAC 1115 TaxID=1967444 RepID=A0A947DK75_9CYAN|nr:hypothetical protein [Leptothoe spongobia]MBT9318003.1 hypothetical protein [Leptothoe spongobia TAU-MAC 1115]
MGQNYRRFLRRQGWSIPVLVAIALFAFHAISTLVFSVLGLAPSSPQWGLTIILGSFLAFAGAAAGLHTLKPFPLRLTGLISGMSSLAILGFYSFGQLSGQNPKWAVVGAVVGAIIGAGFGFWAARQSGIWQSAIALCGGLCAYGVAFGVGTWVPAAIKVGRWDIALVLGLLTGLYLWFTRRALGWAYRQFLT